MGRLVPLDFPLAALDDSERRVVEILRDGLTDGWLILPDVPIQTHRDHQLDIVLVHEDWGVVDVEVKGHRMQLRDGAYTPRAVGSARSPPSRPATTPTPCGTSCGRRAATSPMSTSPTGWPCRTR